MDLSKVSQDDRRRILSRAVEKLGRGVVREILEISDVTLWRMLSGKAVIGDDRLLKILQLLSRDEVLEALGARRSLIACGILYEDGGINRAAAIEFIREASKDEYFKRLLLDFVVANYKEELKKILGIVPEKVELKWDPEFEEFLRERKRRRKIATEETLRYYRSLFMKYLEGKELSRELAEEVARHRNKWVRNVFRHYIQYLFYRREISGETYGWIMEYVPSRSYRLEPRAYEIRVEDLRRTFEYLRNKHGLYYTIYLIMYFSGSRLAHALKLVESWSPDEIVFIEMLGRDSARLVCFDEKGFCRYYLGLRGGSKPCEWIYMPKELVQMIERYRGVRRSRTVVERYAKRHGLIQLKMLRKINWRILVRATGDKDVARFIQSRFGELAISEALYENLLEKTDRQYPKALEELRRIIGLDRG
ncbi:integrase [Desulfurococcus sp.]|uniref:integrase n=1 Tax=Desulfurococcus sp. TaxID=51678 RepID=UPI00319DAEEC